MKLANYNTEVIKGIAWLQIFAFDVTNECCDLSYNVTNNAKCYK